MSLIECLITLMSIFYLQTTKIYEIKILLKASSVNLSGSILNLLHLALALNFKDSCLQSMNKVIIDQFNCTPSDEEIRSYIGSIHGNPFPTNRNRRIFTIIRFPNSKFISQIQIITNCVKDTTANIKQQ